MVGPAATGTVARRAPYHRAATFGLRGGGSTLSLYVDSSALVKLFVAEQGTEDVQELVHAAAFTACARLGYVECSAAITRARRERRLTGPQERRALAELRSFWVAVVTLELDRAVMERAAEICRLSQIRSADAVHLASAEVLTEQAPRAIQFACWNRPLWQTATGLGFDVRPPALA